MAPPLYGIWDDSIPNQSPRLVIVSAVFLAISMITVAMRFGWRLSTKTVGWDDAMALCASILLVVTTSLVILAAEYGFGKPARYIHPELTTAVKYFYIYQIFYKPLECFTKLAFCLLYLRIFPQTWFKRTTIGVMAVVIITSLGFTLGTIFQCSPIDKAWNFEMPGRCQPVFPFLYTQAAFNTFLDIVIFILPIPMISSLQLPQTSKNGLISVFCLGAFVITASIVRMVLLRASAVSSDITWDNLNALMWTQIESNTAVICCCIPVLRLPFIKVFDRVRIKLSSVREISGSGSRRSKHVGFASDVGESNSANRKKDKFHLSTMNQTRADVWYERALRSVLREDRDVERSKSDSQIDLASSGSGDHYYNEEMGSHSSYDQASKKAPTMELKELDVR